MFNNLFYIKRNNYEINIAFYSKISWSPEKIMKYKLICLKVEKVKIQHVYSNFENLKVLKKPTVNLKIQINVLERY